MDDQSDNFRSAAVEDITSGLDRMNVDMLEHVGAEHGTHINPSNAFSPSIYLHQQQQYNINPNLSSELYCDTQMTPDDFPDDSDSNQQIISATTTTTTAESNQRQASPSNILIVTNVDSSVFSDKLVQSKFESLFLAHDPNLTFRYLKSFRRVRLDFTNSQLAERARSALTEYKLGNSIFRCYSAQIIRPNSSSLEGDDDTMADNTGDNNSTQHLNIPKLTKQFLISPPASPPVGWEPVHEGSPCIDVQLMSAIANLIPGKTHEIHPGSESQPGIYVEVCEDIQFEPKAGQRSCARTIPRTMSPFQARQ